VVINGCNSISRTRVLNSWHLKSVWFQKCDPFSHKSIAAMSDPRQGNTLTIVSWDNIQGA